MLLRTYEVFAVRRPDFKLISTLKNIKLQFKSSEMRSHFQEDISDIGLSLHFLTRKVEESSLKSGIRLQIASLASLVH